MFLPRVPVLAIVFVDRECTARRQHGMTFSTGQLNRAPNNQEGHNEWLRHEPRKRHDREQ